MSVLAKIEQLLAMPEDASLEDTAAIMGDEGISPIALRKDARYVLNLLELKDASEKLDRANRDNLRKAFVDCIDSYADAYAAQQSYTRDMFMKLPLSLSSTVELIGLLRVRLAQYNVDLPNGLEGFYSSSIAVLRERYNKPQKKNQAEQLEEPDDQKDDQEDNDDV